MSAKSPSLPDVTAFKRALRGPHRSFFDAGRELILTRAPGRLDCLGGVIDYCGGVVCEMPLREAALLALQKRPDRRLRVHSLQAAKEGLTPTFEMSLEDFQAGRKLMNYSTAEAFFKQAGRASWVAYILGAFLVLQREGKVARFEEGANILLSSQVPLGAGISSSAALEMAAMQALNVAYRVGLEGLEMARLAQIVENRVVGAPCGIMDQITSGLGRENELLILECQPYRILGYLPLPEGVAVAAINSKVKHSVGGSNYTNARVGAFMGHAIILHHLEQRGTAARDADPLGGYLCNIAPEEYALAYRDLLPARISGREFLRRYGGTADPVTQVDPDQTYRIRSRVEHHIQENARVARFRENMTAYARTRDLRFLSRAGQLMYGSHWSYSYRLGLGSRETDLLVSLAREIGEEGGVYGAKITGGGSGGAVALLGLADRLPASVRRIAARYEEATGVQPDLFEGSSRGALAFGHQVVRW